jgi:hypothetical protein
LKSYLGAKFEPAAEVLPLYSGNLTVPLWTLDRADG